MVNADAAIHLIIPIFSIATMFAMGLETTFTDILAPLRNLLAVGIILLVNNILIPLLGFVIIVMPAMLTGTIFESVLSRLVPLNGGQGLGFLLLLLASGSLLAPSLTKVAGGSVPFAKGVMVVLAVATALLVPFELAIICGFQSVCGNEGGTFGIQPGSVFAMLLTYQLIPLAIGIVIKVWYDAIAVQIRQLFVQLTGLTFLVLLAVLVMAAQELQLPFVKLPTSGLLVPVKLQGSATTIPPTNPVDPLGPFGQDFTRNVGNLPANPSVVVITRDQEWALVNGSTTFTIAAKYDSNNKPTTLMAQKLEPPGSTIMLFPNGTEAVVAGDGTDVVADRVAELNKQQLSQALLDAFAIQLGPAFKAPFNKVIRLAEQNTWALVDSKEMYKLTLADADKVVVSQDTTQPIGVVAQFMKTLEAIPIIGPVITFLTSLVTILLPYLLFAAIAALLMLLGRYGGLAVRSSVGITDDGIPRALAISTAVRNVSVALLLADQTVLASVRLAAIATIAVFYLVSLVVAGHQAVQWGKQPSPQAVPEEQRLATSTAAEVTSAPAT